MCNLETRRALAAGIAAVAVLAALPAAAQEREATIGAIAPLTGPAANTGQAAREAYELAVKEWNEGEGDYVTENPPKVQLVVEDSNSRPEVGVSAAQRMITTEDIDMLVGEALHSHVTMTLMELAPQYGLPILSAEPVSSAIADKVLSDPERYALYWKGNFNSDAYGEAVHSFYQWAFEQGLVEEGNRTIAFVVEDTDYGIANAEKIGELFEESGWTVVATETTPTAQTDFYPQLSKLRELDPAIIVSVFTIPNSGVAFVRQMQEQAIETSHLGIYYPTKEEFMEQAADIAEGMFWATLQFSPENIPEHQSFSDKVEAEFGHPATYSHSHDYCVMVIALRALDKAEGGDAEAIAANVRDTDYECLLGRFVFGEDHAIMAGEEYIPVPVAQIQDGTNQIIWPEGVATAEPR